MAHYLAWLTPTISAICDSHLHAGYCGTTDEGPSDCAAGDKGSWKWPPTVRTSSGVRMLNEHMRGETCIARCLECERCRYVSFTLAHRDCSWFHACHLHALESKFSGELWRTVHVRQADGNLMRHNRTGGGQPCIRPQAEDEDSGTASGSSDAGPGSSSSGDDSDDDGGRVGSRGRTHSRTRTRSISANASHGSSSSTIAAAVAPRRRVIDLFAYGGRSYEAQLELRVHELRKVIDTFLIIEPDFSWNRKQGARPISFDARTAGPLRAYAEQLRHYVLRAADLPGATTADAWHNSVISRNRGFLLAYRSLLPAGCASVDNVNSTCELAARHDLVFVSDVDEIPKPHRVQQLVASAHHIRQLDTGLVYALAATASLYYIQPDGHGCEATASDDVNWHYGPKLLSGERLLLLGGQTVRYQWKDGTHVLSHSSWHLTKFLMTPAQQLKEICSYPDGISVGLCGGAKGLAGEARSAALGRVSRAMERCEDVYGPERVPMRRLNVSNVEGMPQALPQLLLRWQGRLPPLASSA